MSAVIIEPNIITNIVQIVLGILACISFYIGYKAYQYQRMEATQKADKQIEQNDKIIGILEKIERKTK